MLQSLEVPENTSSLFHHKRPGETAGGLIALERVLTFTRQSDNK
jgi:hypothetical protein